MEHIYRNCTVIGVDRIIKVLKITFSLLIVFYSNHSQAQSINNVRAVLSNDQIIITYNLNAPDPELFFQVDLYISVDNFVSPLSYVSGDVGPNVKAGFGKRITWMAKQELGDYKGEISFEVRAKLITARVEPLKLVAPIAGKVKSGKNLTIRWEGGKPNENIDIELYENGKFKSKIASTTNRGVFNWKVPKGDKGSEYSLRLNAETAKLSGGNFRIVSGPPILLIAGSGVVLAGTVVGILLMNGKKDGNSDLPNPPGSPDN